MKLLIALVILIGAVLQFGDAGRSCRPYKKYCKYPGLYEDPYDCTAFLQCGAHGGLPVRQYCAPGTIFNPDIGNCDHGYRCKLTYSYNGHGYWKNPCRKRYVHYLPYKYDCRYFIQCSNKRPYVMPCAPGTVWNQHWKTCVHWHKKYYHYKYCKYYSYKGKHHG